MANNPIIGEMDCPGCGAKCVAKHDVRNRIYIACNGEMDDSQCGTRMTLGPRPSRKFVADAVKARSEAAAANQPDVVKKKPAKSEKPLKEKPAKEAANDDGSDGNGDAGGGVAGKFLKRGRA